ncbi:hypothetical protein HN747_01280 [archaeon]|jgi:uncharacterized membrane protein|nr:hypothetical protein [archaeon]
MVNSRGWFRVFEAITASLILLGVFLFVFNEGGQGYNSLEGVEDFSAQILNDIKLNDTLRAAVMVEDVAFLNGVVLAQANNIFNFSIAICDLVNSCTTGYSDKEVFSSQIIISSNPTDYDPKLLKLNVWSLE